MKWKTKTCSFVLRYLGSKQFSRIPRYSPGVRKNVVGKELLISRCQDKIQNLSSLKLKTGYSLLKSTWWLRYSEDQITQNSMLYQNTSISPHSLRNFFFILAYAFNVQIWAYAFNVQIFSDRWGFLLTPANRSKFSIKCS
jgi:hypothetical protein